VYAAVGLLKLKGVMGQEYKANLLGAFASLLLVLLGMTGLMAKGIERGVQELHHSYPSR
jgi:hypothetical protein